MKTKNTAEDDFKSEKTSEQDTMQDTFHQPLNKISKPMVAGILLIIAGIISLILFIQIVMVDESTIQSVYNATQSQLAQLGTNMTQEQLKQGFVICGTIGGVMAVFSILGGVLALKRKLWGVALAASIPQGFLGLLIPGFLLMFVSGILALMGLVLLAFSRKEFQ